jgi:hypothetical protein
MGAAATERQDGFTTAVIQAWNLMDGEIKWEALLAVAEIFGVQDIELFIHSLAQIRDHLRFVAEAKARFNKEE